jgi:hypothetical protein
MQNHKKDVRFSFPLDCFDACGLVTTVVDDCVSRIRGDRGNLLVRIRSDSGAAADAVTIGQGWWHKSGSVNESTSDRISEMGEQAAYYDCFVHVAPAAEGLK